MKKIVHFCVGLEYWNGMANTARQFVAEERKLGYDSILTNSVPEFKLLLKTGVDRVYIHGAWLPVLWKVSRQTKRYGAELYIRPAGSYDPVRLAYHGWKKRLVSWFEHRMLSRADVLLATCKAEVGWIRSYAPNARKIEITDLKRFFDFTTMAEISWSDGLELESGRLKSRIERVDRLEKSEVHLLYLGRQHPLKGVEFLEQAVTALNLNSSNFVIPVQNSSAQSTGLKVCLKIVSNVFGEEKEKVWDWCDVMVLPTLSENFGRVVAEALERGKRVITTDGAPAWGPEECGNMQMLPMSVSENKSESQVWEGYGGRLVYLKGYRDGAPEKRVAMLKSVILSLTNINSNF